MILTGTILTDEQITGVLAGQHMFFKCPPEENAKQVRRLFWSNANKICTAK